MTSKWEIKHTHSLTYTTSQCCGCQHHRGACQAVRRRALPTAASTDLSNSADFDYMFWYFFIYFGILIYDRRDAHASISEFARTACGSGRHAADNAMCALQWNTFYASTNLCKLCSAKPLLPHTSWDGVSNRNSVSILHLFSIFRIFQERERDHFVSFIYARHFLPICSLFAHTPQFIYFEIFLFLENLSYTRPPPPPHNEKRLQRRSCERLRRFESARSNYD